MRISKNLTFQTIGDKLSVVCEYNWSPQSVPLVWGSADHTSTPQFNTHWIIMSTQINTDVVLFALEQCNTGDEMLEYIDSLIEEINVG